MSVGAVSLEARDSVGCHSLRSLGNLSLLKELFPGGGGRILWLSAKEM